MRIRILAIVAIAGCGRLDFEDLPDARAGSGASDATGADATAACSLASPFGAPVPIAELNDPGVDDGSFRLLPDELTGYFWSYRGGVGNIYVATRPDRASRFSVRLVDGVSYTNELDPAISPDGSMLMFRRSDAGDDLWLASRIEDASFAAAIPLTPLNSPASDAQPFFQLAGDDVYFASDRTGAGDIYHATRSGVLFSTPALVDELATPAAEGDPVISADGLALFFRSDGAAPLAGSNVYVATRASTTDRFGAPSLVDAVSSNADEGPTWLSADGCRLYLWSDRVGTADIYVATRGP
jgi:Tol biopolymer transport system component